MNFKLGEGLYTVLRKSMNTIKRPTKTYNKDEKVLDQGKQKKVVREFTVFWVLNNKDLNFVNLSLI